MKRLSGGRLAGLAFAATSFISALALTPARADVVVKAQRGAGFIAPAKHARKAAPVA